MRHSSASNPEKAGDSNVAKRGRRSESGDTLIEVLLAIIILGLASVAIMMAFATSISGSAEHRSLASFDTVLRSASEQAISQLEQQTTSEFGTCPGTYSVNFSLGAPGYSAVITQIQYWNGSSFGSTCIINAPQLITITVTGPTGATYSISVVVDGPLAQPISCATTATHLVFLQIPNIGPETAGSAFGNQPQVAIEGTGGEYVCNDLSYLTLTLNPVSAPNTNLSGCLGSELGGVVSFSGCSTIGAGTYTLTATDGSLTQTSGQFTISAGLATQLVFNPLSPGPGAAGSAIPNVTVKAEDSYGNIVTTNSDTVNMSIGSGPQTTFSSGATAGTMSSGSATFSNLVVDAAGTYTLTATDGSLSQTSNPFAVGAGAVSAALSTVNDSPASVTANGTSSSTVTVTLLDAYSNPVSGKTVSLSDGAASSTISAASGPSNSSGVVTFTVTDTTAQAATYTATDTTDGTTITDTAVVTFTSAGVSKSVSTVSSSPSSVPADGATLSTVTVTLLDPNGNPVAGKAVTLNQGTGSSTISAPSGLSNASGVVTFMVKDAAIHAQSVIYTATDTTDNMTISQTATVIFYGPASKSLSSVNQSPNSVPDDGVTTSTITVTLLDANSNPVPNKTVTLSQVGATSTISAASGLSNASGVVTFTVKDSKAQTAVYTATDTTDAVTITDTATVVFYGTASPSLSTVNPSPSSVTADGNSTSTITVTLLDANSSPVPNKTVTLSQGVGDSTISAASGTSNASGVVTFTVKDSMTQIITYSAVDVTDGVAISDTAVVTFTPGPVSAANSTVSQALNNVADTNLTTTTVSVTVLDANDNPVPNRTVTLSQGTGSSVISAASGPSSASGVVTFTVRDATAQTVTYTATVTGTGGTVITDTAVVTFYTPGTVSRTLSTVNPTVGSVAADGVTTSTITVTVLDGSSYAVPNRTVTLAGTGSSVISAASGVSNASGVVTFTVKDATAQTVTYTATVTGSGGTVINDTAAVAFYTPGTLSRTLSTVNPTVGSVADDGVTTSTVVVTLLDGNGNAVPNKTVTLAQGTGNSTISAASGVSNASGVVTFTVTDTNAETVTYTATVTGTGGTVITDMAVVTFYTPGAVSLTNSSLTANPTTVVHTSYSTITVVLEDSNGNAVPNKTVTLTQGTGGASIISPTSGLSNASGVVTFIVNGTVKQNVTYTATDIPDNLSGTVTVDFS
jgi:type II secretory pathway pseudopilin PulG